MNDREHVFAPTLQTSFIHPPSDSTAVSFFKTNDKRYFFYLLNQPGNYHQFSTLAFNFICFNLNGVNDTYSSSMNHKYHVDSLRHLKISNIAPLPEHFSILENQLKCLRQTTTIQLTQPCWLQNIFQASCCQSKISVQLMLLYLDLKGISQDRISIDESYKSLLLMTGIKQPVLYVEDLSEKTDILNGVYCFASMQLALMRFPRLLFPEILGFTLAYCQMPTLIEVCFPNHQLPSSFFKKRQQHLNQATTVIEGCILDYLALFPEEKDKVWLRVQNGFFLYQQQMQFCRDQFNDFFTKIFSTPQQVVAKLLQQKALAAMGHHQKILIDGITLDQWFSGMPDNLQEFLKVLKKSDYVDTNEPEKSQLLKLFAFEGPMFGVLDSKEQDILLSWLKVDESANSITQWDDYTSKKNTFLSEKSAFQTEKYKKLSNRALYYYLVNADLFPEVLLTAQSRVKKLLGYCNFFCQIPFKRYSHEQFDVYIADIYHREMAAYHPLQGQPKISKSAYVWGLEQIAPMILIDGCWLQNSLSIKNINAEISDILFSIYADEIGNGILEQNHSHIFQQLLDSLSISVPPVHSREFVDHSAFINSAFDLPVYMMALSHFSIQFLPELLGLNMAIELSGLGKSYMRLVDDWNYWDINPTIANIHISIDNYDSGHTFLAKKAIKLYLEQIYQNTADNLIVDQHWRRIFSGYASLRYVGTRFKLALPLRYLISKHFYQHKK